MSEISDEQIDAAARVISPNCMWDAGFVNSHVERRRQNARAKAREALRAALPSEAVEPPSESESPKHIVAPVPVMEPVAWACVKCNSPRSVDPCPKCGTPLTKPAEGWEWPTLPNVDRIRELAREVGYAVGVHGSLERDLDLIAAPWVETAVTPLALAEHIAAGLNGRVVDFEHQDKPCGRWSCNIHTPDWTKMIDLSVMPPASPPSAAGDGRERVYLNTLQAASADDPVDASRGR